MLIQEVRGINPKKKGILPNIYRSNSLIQDGICYLLIDLDLILMGFQLRMMWISIARVDVILAHNLNLIFDALHMGIIISIVGCCAIITHEYFHILAPLDICIHTIHSSKDVSLSVEHLVTPMPPLSPWHSKMIYWYNNLQ